MKAIVISAVWCPSCLIMIGRYHELHSQFSQIEFVEYDFDVDKDAVSKYKVWKTLPVLILIDNNMEVARFIGEKSLKEMTKVIEGLQHD